MANEPYVSNQVSVGTAATKVASPSGLGGILVSCSAATVFGGAGVTTSTGISIAASTPTLIPTMGPTHDLYAVVATGTATVSYIYPGGN
jgi:hypothetical protein